MSHDLNERFDFFTSLIQPELDGLLSMSNRPDMFGERDIPGKDDFFRKMAEHRDAIRRHLGVLQRIEEMHYPHGLPDA